MIVRIVFGKSLAFFENGFPKIHKNHMYRHKFGMKFHGMRQKNP